MLDKRAEPLRDCPRCPRLVAFREAWRTREPQWHNAPVPAFGPIDARLLIVGLAPGLQGANRTGRPFTGDLGRIAHDSAVVALGGKRSAFAFGHGRAHALGPITLFDSYHCSRYNTNTGVLTPGMFRSVFAKVRAHLK
jgi:uracil-DNA glycosylase